jgi:hypothetical protein
MRAFVLGIVAVLALAGAPRPAAATPSMDACTGIIEPGANGVVVLDTPGTWCLDRDHVAGVASSSATRRYINVTADDVTVDCRGHRITSNPASTYDPIAVSTSGRSRVVVRGCGFEGFGWAVTLESGPATGQFLVEDNEFRHNGRAINLNGAGSIVRGNRILDTDHEVALQVSDGGNRVLDNVFDGWTDASFFIWLRGDVEFRGNTLRGMQDGVVYISPYRSMIYADATDDPHGDGDHVATISDNILVASPYTNGISCGGQVHVADNVLDGFVEALTYDCIDQGDNDISP